MPTASFSNLSATQQQYAAAKAREYIERKREEAVSVLTPIQEELKRRRYILSPNDWACEKLHVHLWSGQISVIESVRDNRKTAVQSCHEIGKSFIAAVTAAWWLDIWPVGEAFVVTTAPTGPQVQAILWREIGRVFEKGALRGRVNQTEWFMTPAGSTKEELVAFGRKPADTDMAAFQGIHAKRVLFIGDEACGLPELLLEAADSLIANDYGKALLIGNPDDPTSEFAKLCKPNTGWTVRQIGAFDSPNFTGEHVPQDLRDVLIGPVYVEEKRRKWAKTWQWDATRTRVEPPPGEDATNTHPFWQSKVLGIFPETREDEGLIPLQWIRSAQQRTLTGTDFPSELGGDVGGGGDPSAVVHRLGVRFRVVREDREPDTMRTCGNFISDMRSHHATVVKVDVIGIGRGVVDRAVEQRMPFIGVNVADPSNDPEQFLNLRAELYWKLRERFEAGLIDIDEDDEELAEQLVAIRWKRTSKGQIQIESKDDMKRRGVASPNRADALMLANADMSVVAPRMSVVRLAGF